MKIIINYFLFQFLFFKDLILTFFSIRFLLSLFFNIYTSLENVLTFFYFPFIIINILFSKLNYNRYKYNLLSRSKKYINHNINYIIFIDILFLSFLNIITINYSILNYYIMSLNILSFLYYSFIKIIHLYKKLKDKNMLKNKNIYQHNQINEQEQNNYIENQEDIVELDIIEEDFLDDNKEGDDYEIEYIRNHSGRMVPRFTYI